MILAAILICLLCSKLLNYNTNRWDSENEIKPNPYAYVPFGMGPRNCVGLRFAMEEMKIAMCAMVLKFRFFPVPETPVNNRKI